MNYEYKIHVINRDLCFDKSYKNVVQFFNPTTHQKDYSGVFTSDELTFNEAEEAINFSLNDGINTSVIIDFTDEYAPAKFGASNITIADALSRQYCIVKEIVKNDDGVIINDKLYFYFIDNPLILNNVNVKYNLTLDAFTTYPLYSDISIDKTRILRAHVDRFTLGSTANNATLFLNNKYIETGEETDNKYIKITKHLTPVKFKFYPRILSAEGSELLSESVIIDILNRLRWLYVETRENNVNKLYFGYYNIYEYNGITDITFYTTSGGRLDATIANEIDTAQVVYNTFAENANVINAFISPFGPIPTMLTAVYSNIIYDYKNTGGNRYLKIYFNNLTTQSDVSDFATYYYGNKEKTYSISATMKNASYIYQSDEDATKTFYYESNEIETFNNTMQLTNTPFNYNIIKNTEVKTKMRKCYNEYVLKTELEKNDIDIDLSYLKTNKLTIQAMQDMDVKSNGNIYLTLNNLLSLDIGAHIKGKEAPQFYSDRYKEFIATNKNYTLTGIALPMLTETAGGIVGGAVATGSPIGAIIGAGVGLTSSAIKAYTNYDNMINTPDAIKRKGESNVIERFIKDYPIYIINNELRDEELKAVNLYFYEYGYTINEIDDISNFFTRSSFNYIQLDECEKDIHALINKNILDIIINALKNGVRFWTKNHYINSKFAYTTNNLESRIL